MPSRWKHKLLSVLAESLGVEFVFDFTGGVHRVTTVVALIGAFLPSLGFAMILPSAIWMYWAWWPTVRLVFPSWRLYELALAIENQMDTFTTFGYNPNTFPNGTKRRYLMFALKLAQLGIDARRLEGFKEWSVLLGLATQRRLKDARRDYGIEG